jgi:signal transduction histidine kinase
MAETLLMTPVSELSNVVLSVPETPRHALVELDWDKPGTVNSLARSGRDSHESGSNEPGDLERVREENLDLEKALADQEHLLATLAHELRTPMQSILGWASLARQEHLEGELLETALKNIQDNARVQSALIENIIEVSRAAQGKLQLRRQHLDLADQVKKAIVTMTPLANAKGIALCASFAEGPCFMEGDPVRLQQILVNLLANAIKFSPRLGVICVSCTRTDEQIELTIQDDGQGMSPAFLPHAFEHASQEQAGSSLGGLGIGLALVRELVELHGGRISAESEGVDRGATFVVTFPCAFGAEKANWTYN